MFSRCVTIPPFIVESPTPRNSRGEGSVHASYEFIKARSTFKQKRQAALRTAMQKKEYKDEKQQQLKADLAHIMALVDSTSFEIISGRMEKKQSNIKE